MSTNQTSNWVRNIFLSVIVSELIHRNGSKGIFNKYKTEDNMKLKKRGSEGDFE